MRINNYIDKLNKLYNECEDLEIKERISTRVDLMRLMYNAMLLQFNINIRREEKEETNEPLGGLVTRPEAEVVPLRELNKKEEKE